MSRIKFFICIHVKHKIYVWVSGGFRGGKTVFIEPHKHAGVFIARGKEDALVTKNLVPGESVYGEKRMSVEVRLTVTTSNINAQFHKK